VINRSIVDNLFIAPKLYELRDTYNKQSQIVTKHLIYIKNICARYLIVDIYELLKQYYSALMPQLNPEYTIYDHISKI
jgi:hypothetical protein